MSDEKKPPEETTTRFLPLVPTDDAEREPFFVLDEETTRRVADAYAEIIVERLLRERKARG